MLTPLLLVPVLLQQPAGDHRICQQLTDWEDRRAPRAEAEAALRGQPAAHRASFLQGCLAMADSQWVRATGHFERALEQNPGVATYHLWLGRAFAVQAQRAGPVRGLGLARRVRDNFLRAVELEPDNLDARRFLLEFYLQAPSVAGGSTTRAAEQVEEIRRRNAYLGGLTAGQLAERRRQPAVAEREYTAVVAAHPDSVVPVWALLNIYYRARRWESARALVARLQTSRPNSMVLTYMVGRTAAESGEELAAGEQALRRYLGHTPSPMEPGLANAHWRLGTVLQHRGDRDGARHHYQEAVRLNPELSGAREALARLR